MLEVLLIMATVSAVSLYCVARIPRRTGSARDTTWECHIVRLSREFVRLVRRIGRSRRGVLLGWAFSGVVYVLLVIMQPRLALAIIGVFLILRTELLKHQLRLEVASKRRRLIDAFRTSAYLALLLIRLRSGNL